MRYTGPDDVGVYDPPPQAEESLVGRPGSALKYVIKSWGFEYSASCECDAIAKKMNERGVGWSEQNRDYIERHMIAEARKRGWHPIFTTYPASTIFNRAMRIARGEEQVDPTL